MKNLIIFSLSLLIFSCKETDSVPEKKIIERALIGNEKPMISKTDSVFIGVRYFKNYVQEDKMSLTLNGKKGEMGPASVGVLEGTNYLFKFPPVSTSGDVELILTIENDQNSFTQKKALRIIENYDLGTVWDKADRSYILNSFPLMYFDANGGFGVGGDFSNGYTIGIGTYTHGNFFSEYHDYRPFLRGLNGRYALIYDDSKILKKINIINGDVNVIEGLTYEMVVNDVAQIYGPSKAVDFASNGGKITKFETARFNIDVSERPNISTSITLK